MLSALCPDSFINVQLLVRPAEAPLLAGNLPKLGGSLGGRENWKTRYFVLEDDALSYYESEKAYVDVSLRGVVGFVLASDQLNAMVFHVSQVQPGGRAKGCNSGVYLRVLVCCGSIT